MADSSDRGEPTFPLDVNPTKFATPEMYLRTLQEPGVVALGREFESREEIQSVMEQSAATDFVTVGILVLRHANHEEGVSYFPIYYTAITSHVSGRKFVAPHAVTAEHVEEAERFVTRERFGDTSEEQRARLITRVALALAGGTILTLPEGEVVNGEEEN